LSLGCCALAVLLALCSLLPHAAAPTAALSDAQVWCC